MFDTGRNINLGRRSKQAKDIVDASKRAREERERQRKRERYAKLIQARFRARKQIKEYRSIVLLEWALNNAPYIIENPPLQTLTLAIRQFLFLNGSFVTCNPPQVDILPNFYQLLQALINSITRTDPVQNFASLAFSSDAAQRIAWLTQIQKLSVCCIRCIKQCAIEHQRHQQTAQMKPEDIALPLQFLLLVSDVNNYAIFGNSSLARYIVKSLIIALVKADAISELSSYISCFIDASPSIAKLTREVIRLAAHLISSYYPLAKENYAERKSLQNSSLSFVQSILSRPLSKEFTSGAAGQYVRRAIALALVECPTLVSDVSATDKHKLEAAFNVLENMAALLNSPETGQADMDKLFGKTAQLANTLDSIVWKKRKEVIDYLNADTDAMEDDECPKPEDEALWTYYFSRLQQAVHNLLSPATVSMLVNNIKSVDATLAVAAINDLAKLVRTNAAGELSGDALVQQYKSLSEVLLPMWPEIRNILTGQGKHSPTSTIEAFLPLIGLFANCYAYLLQDCIDDYEFYELQKPFTLKEVSEMVNIAKNFAVQSLTQYKQSNVKTEWDATLQAFNAVLSNLFRRNNRRQFVSPSTFFALQLKADDMLQSTTKHPIIANCPVIIPTTEKVKLLHHWINEDKEIHQANAPIGDVISISIRRTDLLKDAYTELNCLRSQLKKMIKVEFISKEGIPEAGIDGGGLFRELLTEVVSEAFSPKYGLFTITNENTLYPNPNAEQLVDYHLSKMEFLGRILGKCVYELLLVDLPLAPFFITHVLRKKNGVNDLQLLDSELLKNLTKLKRMSPEELERVGATFTTVKTDFTGSPEVVELIPGGSQTVVTSETVQQYLSMVADYKLNKLIHEQSLAFSKGFYDIIDPSWVSIFTEEEFLLNISGLGSRIDVQDLMNNCRFSGGFHENHKTILLLWEVLNEMTDEQQQQFLKFCTSHSRPPILGFATLNPKFCLHKSSDDVTRLPSANTCLNLLKFPAYKTKEQLREKFLYAISSGAGFELS